MKKNYMNKGKKLKKLLFDKKMTQNDLANLLGVSRSAVGHYVSRGEIPDIMLDKICEVLNVEKSYFDVFVNNNPNDNNPDQPEKQAGDWSKPKLILPPENAKYNVIVLPYKVPAGIFNNQDPDWDLCEKLYLPGLPNILHFGIYATGESMQPTINENDMVICLPHNPFDGLSEKSIYVIVSTDGNTTVKRIREKENELVLIPDNEEMAYMTVKKENVMQILKAVGVFKKF
ncbi:MAG: XRE family transcriptional regulator [Bacteroidia bacterium]|nr:XRE family transcriptional regulator [Bacteroidia bacterium]